MTNAGPNAAGGAGATSGVSGGGSKGNRPPMSPASRPQALHAPWRLSYMDMLSAQDKVSKGAGQGAASNPDKPRTAPCFLRAFYLNPSQDSQNHVIVRTGMPGAAGPHGESAPGEPAPADRGGLILLNKYPYANGHLLVCLGEGRSRLLDYSEAQRAELWSLVDLAVDLVERALMPQGVNVGLNQGAAAGAGVPEHAHVHVVPRWAGDVNFMSVCAQVRVIPSALEDMARRMREVWEGVRGSGD